MLDIGDRVRHSISGSIGIITGKHKGKKYPYIVIWNDKSHTSGQKHSYRCLVPEDYYQDFYDKIKDRIG